MSWKAIDRYSKDYIELQTKDKVRFYKTPDSVLQKQLEVYDQVVDQEGDGQSAVQGDHRVPAGVRRAGGEVGSRHQRQPAHGLQPLLRQAGPRRRASPSVPEPHARRPSGSNRVAGVRHAA